ncbi:MAG: dihydropteroate synthase [Anaerolineae bacterium]|nr:dihydropteroate synthase [Anaerolineae bacterium]
MKTVLRGTKKEVVIQPDALTVIIGERINPTGRKKLAAALVAGDLEYVRREAVAQVREGAHVIDVNVGAAGVDEVDLLPKAVLAVAEVVDVPICIDSSSVEAIEAALAVCPGRPLVNSVNGEEEKLERILPLVKKYNAAVIGLTMDDKGIPNDPHERLAIAKKIVDRAEAIGIAREDVIIDCLALTMGADSKAGLITLKTIELVRKELGNNITLGASNASFGLPEREVINAGFLAMAVYAGMNCPIVNPRKSRLALAVADLVLGRDDYAMNYLRAYRELQKLAQEEAQH